MLAANVPCTPGYHGSNQDPSFLQAQAENIGYPVLLKAVHGGGGKGMRIAHSPDTFAAQLESAKSEARNSFGNDTMLIEKYITRPRHVEVQIFGDKHGNVVSLGERDCSIQRRHQKIIEESPAPGLSNAQREDLWQKAIQAGKAVNYVGAGTVEFIFDANTGGFFFMEMNTRLQVEHPVTEMCTDLDLVEWQLRIARGEPIPLTQAQIQDRIARNGHAIEARIYAEDPEMDFLPTAGTLTHLALPEEIHGSVRIDTAIKQVPTTISSHYDPMISKLIVRGPDRETALRRLRSALERYEIAGLTTNIEFLKRLCANEHFVSDTTSLDTAFITKHHDELFEHEHTQPEVWAQAALGLFLRQSSLQPATSALNESIGFDSASTHSGFASRSFDLAANPTPTTARTRGPTVTVDIQQLARDRFTIVVQSTISKGSSESLRAVFKNVNAKLSSTQGPQSHVLSAHFPHTHLTSTVVLPSPDTVLDQGLSITLFDRGRRYDLTSPPPEWLRKALGKSPVAADEANVAAPMPSKILRVEIQAGEVVKKDQPLVVVESMKMEMVIRAPREGLVVKRVAYQAGVSTCIRRCTRSCPLTLCQEICKAGAVLVEFENESRTAIDPTA